MAEREAGPGRGVAATVQVPREEWKQFLDQFTEFNAEMPVRIELVGSAATGVGRLAENQPLLDVTLDEEAGVPVILIECGDPATLSASARGAESLRHVVREPTVLWARTTEPAGYDALEIVCSDGAVILSLAPRQASIPPQEDAAKELLQGRTRGAV